MGEVRGHGRRTLAYAALLCMAGGGLPSSVCAGEDPTTLEGQSQIEPAEGVNTGRNTVVVPIPVSNPTVGTGLALAGMILYKVDQASPDSSTTLGGGYLSSESWLVGGAQKLNFDADRYRLNAVAGVGQINYDFFGIGSSATSQGIPLRQKVFGGTFDFRREIIEGLHVGARWIYANVKTAVGADLASQQPELQGKELDLTVSGMGLVASWDTRDRQYSPTRGTFAEFKSNFASEVFGSDLNYQTYSLAWNAYYTLDAPNVLAARIYLCKVSESAPFFDTCAFGAGYDLRGFEAGRYRDLNMIAGQVEYRRSLFGRFGAVAFVGGGSVADTFGNLFSSTLLPAGGIGLRYLAVPASGVNVSVDYAWGKSGSGGLYVYIGDAF